MRAVHVSMASVAFLVVAFAQPCRAIDWQAFDDPKAKPPRPMTISSRSPPTRKRTVAGRTLGRSTVFETIRPIWPATPSAP